MERSPSSTAQLGPEVRHSIEKARNEFDAAITNADTSRLAAIVDTAAVFVTANGQTLRGPRVIASAVLGDRYPAGKYGITVSSEDIDLCFDGGIQSGTYSISRIELSNGTGIESGAYAIRWLVTPQGARIRQVGFADSRNLAENRAGSCSSLKMAAFYERRFEASIGRLATTSTPMGSLESALTSKGWTRTNTSATQTSVPSGQFDGFTLIKKGGESHDLAQTMVSAAVRLAPRALAQVSVQPFLSSAALATFNPGSGSRLIQSASFREMSAELVVELGGLRFGAGPVRVTSDWSERYDHVVLVSGTYVTDYNTISDGQWNRSSVGVAGEVSYVRPFINSSFNVGILARGRVVSDPSFDGVPTHQNWSTSLNSVQFGLKGGLAW